MLGAALASGARANELADAGVAPTAELRLKDLHGPTPATLPGGQVVTTTELRRQLQAEGSRPLLFDVLGGDGHASLPGAIWLPGAGRGTGFADDVQRRLARVLEMATQGDLARPMVFFCSGKECWLSYNAALRAVRLGYTSVLWYRGGIEAWGASGGALSPPRLVWKPED